MRIGYKVSSTCIIHGEEERLPRGVASRFLGSYIVHTIHKRCRSALRVPTTDRFCRSGTANPPLQQHGELPIGLKILSRGVFCWKRRANNVVRPCLPRRVNDAEKVDISAVGNPLLHGDARDNSFSRFVGVYSIPVSAVPR